MVVQVFQARAERRETLKMEMAAAAQQLMQDPEHNASQLPSLIHLCRDADSAVRTSSCCKQHTIHLKGWHLLPADTSMIH